MRKLAGAGVWCGGWADQSTKKPCYGAGTVRGKWGEGRELGWELALAQIQAQTLPSSSTLRVHASQSAAWADECAEWPRPWSWDTGLWTLVLSTSLGLRLSNSTPSSGCWHQSFPQGSRSFQSTKVWGWRYIVDICHLKTSSPATFHFHCCSCHPFRPQSQHGVQILPSWGTHGLTLNAPCPLNGNSESHCFTDSFHGTFRAILGRIGGVS
jgi:hypothetical protein